MAGARRKARVLALQALYEVDSAGHKAEQVIEYFGGGSKWGVNIQYSL